MKGGLLTAAERRSVTFRRDCHYDFESGLRNFKKLMKPLGFGKKTRNDIDEIKREVLKAAEDRFSPEFRNRIDEIRSVFAVDTG
jgi:hypothetical protein